MGIEHIRSRPKTPSDNGAHERLHKDIEEELEAKKQRTEGRHPVPRATLTMADQRCSMASAKASRLRPDYAQNRYGWHQLFL